MEKQHSDLVLLYIVPSHWKLIMSGLFPRDVLLIQGAVGIGREPCMGNNKILTELPRRYIFNISQATLSLTRDAQLHVISATEYKQLVYSYFMCNVPELFGPNNTLSHRGHTITSKEDRENQRARELFARIRSPA